MYLREHKGQNMARVEGRKGGTYLIISIKIKCYLCNKKEGFKHKRGTFR